VAVDVFREPASSGDALRQLAVIEASLEKSIGKPTSSRGDKDAAYLSGSAPPI
jgi:hypothetical protein